jgi:GMP reductase
MRIRDNCLLDFQDVLLVPQRSGLDSRAEVELEREFRFPHADPIKCCPIIAANLDTTGSFAMAKALAEHHMLTALNKHYSIDELFEFFKNNINLWDFVFYTVGTSESDLNKLCVNAAKIGHKEFPRLICLDAANAYVGAFEDALVALRKQFPHSVILAGNVATGNMTEELLLKGADIVKVGIGSGSLCETRIKTGVGVPQLSATDMCSFQAHGLNKYVCSDGGVVSVGDICKALCVGADFVMLGGFFCGVDECEGEWITDTMYVPLPADVVLKNKIALKVHGMSSRAAMIKYNGGVASHRTSEGREVEVPCKGPVSDLIQDIKGGIASCCTYIGCTKIKDMPKCAEFVRVHKQYNDVFERK